jgi:hypothetical protein
MMGRATLEVAVLLSEKVALALDVHAHAERHLLHQQDLDVKAVAVLKLCPSLRPKSRPEALLYLKQLTYRHVAATLRAFRLGGRGKAGAQQEEPSLEEGSG